MRPTYMRLATSMLAENESLAIFDHVAKTAGSAIATWACAAYGAEKVLRFRHGLHSHVASHRPPYKVACGHTYFQPGEGLSERCKYLTLLRNPVDRVVSWLYFALAHQTEDMSETKSDCIRFLQGQFEGLCHNVTSNISNVYVDHFGSIHGGPDDSDDRKLRNALSALEKYDVVGRYEDIGSFRTGFVKLVGRGRNVAVSRENVTRSRPNLQDLPRDLRRSIEKRNEPDVYFYNQVCKRIVAESKSRQLFFFRRFPAFSPIPAMRTPTGLAQ